MDKVDICNLALTQLGVNRIVSMDDKNDNAKMCRLHFPVCVDRCLRDHAWSFATMSLTPPTTSEISPDADFRYVYNYPADCIRVLSVSGGYRIFGNKILAKSSDAKITYIGREQDSSRYDVNFIEALQYLLTAELALAFTRDSGLAQLFHSKYQDALARARSIDLHENSEQLVDICNLALSQLGVGTICSFDDGNDAARMCRMFYPACLDRCLRDHDWSFATAVATLRRVDEISPDPGFPFVCKMPDDCLRILEVAGGHRIVGGRKILARRSDASISYIMRVDDANNFDVTFKEALEYLLASEIALALIKDAGIAQMYRKEYQLSLARARSIDSQENLTYLQGGRRQSRWIESRIMGGDNDYMRVRIEEEQK